jgi:hypothetical protein
MTVSCVNALTARGIIVIVVMCEDFVIKGITNPNGVLSEITCTIGAEEIK